MTKPILLAAAMALAFGLDAFGDKSEAGPRDSRVKVVDTDPSAGATDHGPARGWRQTPDHG